MTNLVSKLFAFFLLLVVFVANPALASTWATFDSGNCDANYTLSGSDLTITAGSAMWTACMGTISKNTGKWYWEYTIVSTDAAGNTMIGIGESGMATNNYVGFDALGFSYYGNTLVSGNAVNSNSFTGTYATFTSGDVIGVALDLDNGTLEYFKNGVTAGTFFTSLAGDFFPAASCYPAACSITANFGATAFAEAVPAGFEPGLCAETTCGGGGGGSGTTEATDFPAFYEAHKVAIMWIGACMLLVGFVHIFFQVGKSVLQWLKFNS